MSRKISVEIVSDSSRLNAGFRSATVSTNEFVRGLEKTGRGAIAGTVAITGMGRAIAFASAQFLGGYGLLYGLTKSLDSAIKFQQSMALLQTQAGSTAGEVQRMTKAVLQLAPAVGSTPEQLAQGLYHVESSGIRGAKALETLKIAAEGAKLGGADLESVTTALVAAQKSGITGAQGLGKAMGALDAIIGSGNMRMEDLTKALSSGVLTSAKAFGVGLNDVGAALSTLTVQGIPAQLAATRLRTSFSFLAAGTPAAERALKKIGLTTHELGETMRHQGLGPALDLISAKLKQSGMDATQQANVIVRAFGGARTATTIISLLQSRGLFEKNFQAINIASHNFATKWAAEQKTAQYATDQLKATVMSFADTIGLGLLPTVSHVSKSLSHWIANTDNQKRIQRDLTQAVGDTKDVATTFYKLADTVANSLGGWHNAVEALIGLKIAKWIVDFGVAAKNTATYIWGLATAEQAAAVAGQEMAAGSGIAGVAGAAGAGRAVASGAGAAATGSAMSRLVFGRAEEANGVLALNSAAMQREAAIARMMTGTTVFGGAAMLRTAGGERQILSQAKLDKLNFGEGAQVTEQVRPGFAGAVRPAMFSGGQGVLASGASASSTAAAVETGTVIGGLTAKFPKLATEITGVKTALGSAGLAASAGFASYELTGFALHATHADTVLKKFGGTLAGLGGNGTGPAAATQTAASQAIEAAKKMIGKVGVTAVAPGPESHSLQGPANLAATIGKQLTDSTATKRIEIKLKKLFPNITDHDLKIFINAARQQVQKALDINKIVVNAVTNLKPQVVPGNFRTDSSDFYSTASGLAPAQVSTVDHLSQITQQLAQARLEVAQGNTAANAKIIAALRQQIAYDARYAKIQEGLIKKNIGDAKQHSATISKLLTDEASAYGDIKSIQDSSKKDFALPMALQIAQAKAANTSSLADDNAIAAQITKVVSAQIKAGKYKGAALVAAIQALGAAQQQVSSFTLPIGLQIKQAEAATTATMTDDIKVAQQIKDLVKSQIKAGKLKGQNLISALGYLASANQVLNQGFQIPMKLQLASAKAATTSVQTDDRAAALNIKKIAEAYLKSKKRTSEGMLAAYNAITQANSTLGTKGVATAYKMASTHALTAGLGLTGSQRVAEEQRIAQMEAHGGRIPRKGFVGALGFPVNASPAANATRGAGNAMLRLTGSTTVHADRVLLSGGTSNVTININGGDIKQVERVVTKVLQKQRSRSAPQRRGSNGGHTLGID